MNIYIYYEIVHKVHNRIMRLLPPTSTGTLVFVDQISYGSSQFRRNHAEWRV